MVGLLLMNAPWVALVGGLFLWLLYCAWDSADRDISLAILALLLSAAVAVVGYYLLFRPLWREMAYYWSCGSNAQAAPAVEERQPPLVGLHPVELLHPDSEQCDRVIAACHAALDSKYTLRQMSDKERPRHEKLLKTIVNPVVAGQIELLDACEVSRPPQRLIYAVVSYRHEYPSGRSRVIEQRVGQLVMITLACDIGRLWIRPETMSDKLVQWWDEDDLDFADHPQFSHRYHCQSDNATLILLRVPDAVWQAIGKRDAMIIRAQGTNAIVAREGHLDPEHSVEVVELGFELMAAFAHA